MGLDFSHCDAGWSYSGFNRFRERIAQHLGFDLNEMDGYNGHRSWDEINDDIKPLLNHSDCDGDLSSEECARVYPRLREIIKEWEKIPGHDYDELQAEELAKGMERAAKRKQKLTFR